MPGDSRSKNGVASLAYGAGHPRLVEFAKKNVVGRGKPGHDYFKVHSPNATLA
jgi:hypothetical protein